MKQIAIWIILAISHFFKALGWRACRFHPSCSVYATDVFSQLSLARAMRLTLWRFMRCHPFSSGGFDPAPAKGKVV